MQIYNGKDKKQIDIFYSGYKKINLECAKRHTTFVVQKQIKDMKKVNAFGNTTIYQYHINGITLILEVERVRDRKGTLLRCECKETGLIECYGMTELKKQIELKLNK